MSLRFVANLHISEATLKSYEMGTRLVRFDVMYQLSQVYDVSIDDLIHNEY
jgi:transcriptional regulator with XRE-family HTH domain